MELIARLGERVERVSIERRGEQYRIRVGEREHQVEARSLGPFVQSLIVDGESHETAVFRTGGGWSVSWRGRTTAVELVDPLTHLAEQAHGAAVHSGRQVVAAYMPGRVVAVAVAAGQAIEAGAALVVLEAMKMQNEIRSPAAGIVDQVKVERGQAVASGALLLTLR
jgi:biotin carboxyl carrier protein